MVHRVGGRRAWLPASLLWFPLLVAGVLLLVDFGLTVRSLAPGEHSVRLHLDAPSGWFEDPVRAVGAVALLVTGFLLSLLAQWRPAEHVPLRVVRFGGFSIAAWLLLLLGGMAFWDLSGHVLDTGTGGFDWRFKATVRGHPLDQALAWTAWTLALVCQALSFGRPRRQADLTTVPA